jgi:hypothetical protein
MKFIKMNDVRVRIHTDHSETVNNTKTEGIRVIEPPANTTPLSSPLDFYIFGLVKKEFRING